MYHIDPRNNFLRRASSCSALDFSLWKRLFGANAFVEKSGQEEATANHQPQPQPQQQQQCPLVLPKMATTSSDECAALQKDRLRKMERRRKNKKRRNRKKTCGKSSSDSESSKSGGSHKSDDDSGEEFNPVRKSPKNSMDKVHVFMYHDTDDGDDDDDDLIAFETADVAKSSSSSGERRNSKSSKPCILSFFGFDDSEPEDNEDDDWDVMDESEQSSEDHAELLMDFVSCGMMMSNLCAPRPEPNCDKYKSNNSGTSTFGGNDKAAATTSAAINIPSPMMPGHFSYDSPDMYGTTPDDDSSPLSEDTLKLQQSILENEQQNAEIVEQAQQRWAHTLQQWKEEMGPELAPLLDQDTIDDDEEQQAQQVDKPKVIATPHRVRTVRFTSDEPEECPVPTKQAEDRKGQWEELMRDRHRLERQINDAIGWSLMPEHRDRIYRERFAADEEEDLKKQALWKQQKQN